MNTPDASSRPWSSRSPQKYVLSLIMLVLAVALVLTGLGYIADGRGGLVPYLIIIGGPILSGFYIWYFLRYQQQVEDL